MNGQLKTSGKPTTRILSMVLATAACAGSLTLHAPASARADSACGDTTAGLVLGTGADTHLSEQLDQGTMKDDALAGVTKWRQDALDSTAKLWNGQTVKQYLAQHGISEDTYLHPGWNHDLERIAIQRAVEANVAWDHTRPNAQAWSSVTTTSGTSSQAEALATDAMPDAIDSWASEKQTVLDHPTADNSRTAADYLFLINPDVRSYGFADANGNAGIGEASTLPASDDSQVGWTGICDFEVPTLARDLTPRLSPASAVEGQTKHLVTAVTGTWKGWVNEQQQSILVLRGDYTSSDPDVAEVTGTTLTANGFGTTTLSVKSGDQSLQVGQFQVTAGSIVSISDVAVTTASGTAPTLPSTVSVTWKNGGTTSRAVNWGSVPTTWRNRAGGTFTVTGIVAGWKQPVKAVVTVTPATPTGARPMQAWTRVGLAPTLPTQAQVTWSNGDTTTDPVAWDAVAPASYAQPGTFTVPGRVTVTEAGDASLAASATVTVSARSASAGFLPVSGSLPVATGLLGEATGDKLADVWGIDAQGTLDFHRYTGSALVKVGVRGEQLDDVSYLAPVQDQNGDGRADFIYRTRSDGSLWFAYNLGNGYLKQGPKVGANWNVMDQIFYAGQMVAGSNTQYVLARRSDDGSLWRYTLTSKGLSHGVQVGHGWAKMRVMASPGSMWGDAAWDVIGIADDGNMYGFRTRSGQLDSIGKISHGWNATNSAFVPGDLTGDGRLDLMGQRDDGSVWVYRNTGTGWATVGQRASGFAYRVLG